MTRSLLEETGSRHAAVLQRLDEEKVGSLIRTKRDALTALDLASNKVPAGTAARWNRIRDLIGDPTSGDPVAIDEAISELEAGPDDSMLTALELYRGYHALDWFPFTEAVLWLRAIRHSEFLRTHRDTRKKETS